jgi:hypothetical protein
MDAQFNVLNNLIAQNRASSDEMMKKMSGELEIQAYKNQMIKAQQEIRNAPGELKAAEKAYLTKKYGITGYQDYKEKEAEKEMESYGEDKSKYFNDDINHLRSLVELLASQTIYTSRMDDIRNDYVSKEKDLENKVKSTRSKKNVDDRLANFYNKQVEFNNEFTWYLDKIYWGFIFIFLAAIIYTAGYKNKATIAIFLSLVLIPFVGRPIREWINIDYAFRKVLEYFSQVLMYITFSIRVLLDKLF